MCKVPFLCNVAYLQTPGVRTRTTLAGHYSTYHSRWERQLLMPEAKPLLSNLYDVFHKLQSVITWLLTSPLSHYGLSVHPIAVGLGHVTCVAHWKVSRSAMGRGLKYMYVV